MNTKREIAKFACGFEAFHVLFHAFMWLSGTTLLVLGITLTPTLNIASLVVNAVFAIFLYAYAWGLPKRQPLERQLKGKR